MQTTEVLQVSEIRNDEEQAISIILNLKKKKYDAVDINRCDRLSLAPEGTVSFVIVSMLSVLYILISSFVFYAGLIFGFAHIRGRPWCKKKWVGGPILSFIQERHLVADVANCRSFILGSWRAHPFLKAFTLT